MQRNQGAQWQPVAAVERYPALDVLRGAALFGVLLINLMYFFRMPLLAHTLEPHQGVDWLAERLVEFKAFALFNLSFGIGLGVQAERALERGVAMELFLLRRYAVLLLFGTLHMLFISNVDILMLYAVCGMMALPLLRLPAVGLALLAGTLLLLPDWSPLPLPPSAGWQNWIARANHIYSSGGYVEILNFRWQETRAFILPFVTGVGQRTLALTLLGVAVWRSGVVRDSQRYSPLLWVTVVLGMGSGVLFRADVATALSYAALLLLFRPKWPLAAAAGRMALTNYLTQSVIASLIFYGYGLGLFGKVGTVAGLGMVVAIYVAQLYGSAWWLRRYRFGPCEWLWRSLTYGRRQPMSLN